MKKLILHVGLPKTGTSAIQTALFNNCDVLKNYGVTYPDIMLKYNPPKHQKLVKSFRLNDFEDLDKLLKINKFKSVLMSTEGISNHLYDFSETAFKTFNKVTNDYELLIIYVTREKENWLRSYYTQAVFNPLSLNVNYYGTSLLFSKFVNLKRVRQLSNFCQLRKDLITKLNPKKLIQIEYSHNIIPDFLTALELPKLNVEGNEIINYSPPKWTIELMRQINGLTQNELYRSYWKKLIKQVTGTNHTMITKLTKNTKINRNILKDQLKQVQPISNDEFSINDHNIERLKNILK